MHLQRRFWLIASLLISHLIFIPSQTANATPISIYPEFNESSRGIFFNGNSDSLIQVPANAAFDVDTATFTIDWWQKAGPSQYLFPRLFQFGAGGGNSDGFAVSEESGNIYFWLDDRTAGNRGASRLRTSLPADPFSWNHFAIVRTADILILFKNGLIEDVIDTGYANLGTPDGVGLLDLFMGGSVEDSLGWFEGEITGFEIIKGARWTNIFTPPTRYTNESCLRRDSSNNCELERVLLIYPTSDFKQAGNQLKNLMDNTDIIDYVDVSYGNPAFPAPDNIYIQINPSSNGEVCIDDLETCYTETSVVTTLRAAPYKLSLIPFEDFQVDSITIWPRYAESITVNSNAETFTVTSVDNNHFDFVWNKSTRLLTIPSGFTDFIITSTFKVFVPPPNIAYPSGFSGTAEFDSDLMISSIDPDTPNNYNAVEEVIMKLQYFPHNPLDPLSDTVREECRISLDWDDWDYNELLLSIPPIWIVNEICPNYHQFKPKSRADIYLFETPISDIDDVDLATATQTFYIDIDNPPGIQEFKSETNIAPGQEIKFTTSNRAKVRSFYFGIQSEDFQDNWCTMQQDITDETGAILIEYLDLDGNLVIDAPTLEDLYLNCRGWSGNPLTELRSGIYSGFITVLDQSNTGEIGIELNLNIPIAEPPAPTPAPTPIPTIPAPLPTPTPTPEIDKPEVAPPVISKPVEEKVDTSWCTKKGIFIFTLSGKLQLCDPIKKIAVEMKACAGREKTPTYPWIFRAQRFIVGTSLTKSGTKFYNAIFFFKGLAISGSNSVADKPCSAGSVFIPMQYSKMLFDYAKLEKPLIWVKAV